MDKKRSDREVYLVFRKLFSCFTENLDQGKHVVFPLNGLVFPEDRPVEKTEDIRFESMEQDISRDEALHRLGVVLYHLLTGESELNSEKVLLDGYVHRVNCDIAPIIHFLLSGRVSDEQLEALKEFSEFDDFFRNYYPD